MTPAERGFLLLCCNLGDPEEKPLTLAQLRTLRRRMQEAPPFRNPERDLEARDLMLLGLSMTEAEHIAHLLSRTALLDTYLQLGREQGVTPLTCRSADYPPAWRQRLGNEAPAVLFAKGDLMLLGRPCIALVGSREIGPANESFARHVGKLAAQEGWVLVSGNARGTDRIGQDACLEAGGQVISILADSLLEHTPLEGQLLLAPDSFHTPFSAPRALYRNVLIHALPEKVFVAQSQQGHGGTWGGTVENLRRGLSPVFVYGDGSAGAIALAELGAQPVEDGFPSISELLPDQISLFAGEG